MMRPDEIEDETRSQIGSEHRVSTQPRLLAIWDGGSSSCFLPPSGNVMIGRSHTADLRIASTSVSRQHALISGGAQPTIQDLHSSNGTRVDGQRLEGGQSVPLSAGRVVELGEAVVILQEGQAQSEPPSTRGAGLTLRPVSQSEGKMDRLYRLVDLVATGTLSVILQGETGVGKEVMAKRIHQRSARADKPFLKINCAAFAESMVESELFGHERGAFTGAAQAKAGLLETASGGTVLLDEVAELSLPMQAKLLRAVGSAEVLRIGSLKPRSIDVRFISATNGDFDELILRGAFRSDLYFRLNGICLTIPPLRERVAEIVPLAKEFVADSATRLRVPTPALSERALTWLSQHSWPGNVRELRSVVERAVLLARGGTIEVEHLQVDPEFSGGALRVNGTLGEVTALRDPPRREPALTTVSAPPTPAKEEPGRLRDEVERLERDRIANAIARCGGNQTKAAELLGMSRRALLNRLDAYNLPRPRKGA
jgi:two-component system response regulator AtoC